MARLHSRAKSAPADTVNMQLEISCSHAEQSTRRWWLSVRIGYNNRTTLLMDNTNEITKEFDMNITMKKTKVMYLKS